VRITSVALENIKSYQKIEVLFSPGTTAIRGHNGAGKSTLVEAVGFALFDSINYSQDQFVREGERYGVVTVSFISAEDDREYQAVRRCGSSPTWYIYDPEIQTRVVEQKVDVNDFLRRHLRIETEISLHDLFNDALGIPQGTFTADFLLTPANRKRKFDTLLQIEEYRKAAEKLNETRVYLQEERHAVLQRIGDLKQKTDQIDEWRAELAQFHEDERTITVRLQELQQERVLVDKRLQTLQAEEKKVETLKSQAEVARIKSASAEKQRVIMTGLWDEAREARRIYDETSGDFERYRRAEKKRSEVGGRLEKRDELQKQRAETAEKHAGVARDLHNARTKLEDTTQAAERLRQLAPGVRRQETLERERDEARKQTERAEETAMRLARLQHNILQYEREIEARTKIIAELEQLRSLAALLDQRREKVTMLQDLRARQSERKKRLGQIAIDQRQVIATRTRAAGEEDRRREDVRKIRANQSLAEELPALEEQWQAAADQVRRIEVRLEQHRRSSEASVGGNCPFLQEPCLNIQKKGQSSLTGYFERLTAKDSATLAEARNRLAQVESQRDHAREVRKYFDRLDMYLHELENAAEQRMEAEKRLQALAAEQLEIEDAERSSPSPDELAEAQKLFKASDDADRQLRELGPRHSELAQLTSKRADVQKDIDSHQSELATLAPARTALAKALEELATLGDLRAESLGLQPRAGARPELEKAVTDLNRQVQNSKMALSSLEKALLPYAELDREMKELAREAEQAQPGYLQHLQFQKLAEQLLEREKVATQASRDATAAQTRLARAENDFQKAEAAFDKDALKRVEQQSGDLHQEDGRKREELSQKQKDSQKLEADIARVEALLTQLSAEHEEYATVEDLESMLQQFRDTMREAGPNIMKALLRAISAQANRIFGEIMGDRSAELMWTNDYEIVLRKDGQERTFAQLSGGEQMSAALAVRLALLRHLTRLDIAFFDEPTQNMDGERRENLAEQIRRVRGFDQLIVISHDDTFEQGLDSVIHLEKRDGKTILVEGDMLVPA
jgi:exonuclease SbcC